MQLKTLFKEELPDEEKVLIDVKSLYRKDELEASGMMIIGDMIIGIVKNKMVAPLSLMKVMYVKYM